MSVSAKNHEDLLVWQKAVDVAAEVYTLSRRLPREELFGITQQLRSAVVSISSNVAEGTGRFSRKEVLHFLAIARGSLREVESLLSICVRLTYLSNTNVTAARELLADTGRLLSGLRRSLATKH